MIDYEKLLIAHELLKNISNGNATNLGFKYLNGEFGIYFYHSLDKSTYEYKCFDDLIAKLRELTQPEPRYKVGDKVWVRDYEFGPVETMICEIDTASKEMYYENEYQEWREEKEIYPSRQALIDAQIEYWSSLKKQETSTCSEDVSMECEDDLVKCANCNDAECEDLRCGQFKCEHEPDIAYFDSKPTMRCKKCGEFFR